MSRVSHSILIQLYTGNRDILRRKHKAITALFPYAAWQERDQQYPILDVPLYATGRSARVLWGHVRPFLETLRNDSCNVSLKRAVISTRVVLFTWIWRHSEENLVRAWATTAPTIPKEEKVAPSVFAALLRSRTDHHTIMVTFGRG